MKQGLSRPGPLRLLSGPGAPLQGRVSLPGDKSLSHRAALLAAMAVGESRIENFLVAGVTRAMLRSLSALGVDWELEGTILVVRGQGLDGFRPPQEPLDCGNSATTMRLLAGALAAAGIPAVLDGSPGLRSRPMTRIVAPLQAMGVPLVSSPGGVAPLEFSSRPTGRPLIGIEHHLAVASAQVKSCLLLAGLAAEGRTVLHEPGISRDHTERMLRGLGISVETLLPVVESPIPAEGIRQTAFHPVPAVTTILTPPRPLSLPPLRCALPGDFSSAAFLIVAALAVPGSEVTLRGIGLNPARTGLLDALLEMGANIQMISRDESSGEPVGDLLVSSSPLHGIEVGGSLVPRMIDEFPVFAVAAALAGGRTVVRGAGELRHKESDRISALCNELRTLGVEIEETEDGFEIHGGRPIQGGKVYTHGDHRLDRPIQGGTVQTHGDHRLVMSLAIAGLCAGTPVTVQGAEIIAESFPDFVPTLQSLGASISLEEG